MVWFYSTTSICTIWMAILGIHVQNSPGACLITTFYGMCTTIDICKSYTIYLQIICKLYHQHHQFMGSCSTKSLLDDVFITDTKLNQTHFMVDLSIPCTHLPNILLSKDCECASALLMDPQQVDMFCKRLIIPRDCHLSPIYTIISSVYYFLGGCSNVLNIYIGTTLVNSTRNPHCFC